MPMLEFQKPLNQAYIIYMTSLMQVACSSSVACHWYYLDSCFCLVNVGIFVFRDRKLAKSNLNLEIV